MAVPRCSRRCDCPPCVIGEGDFSGAATTTVPGFTEVEGDWKLDGAGYAFPVGSPAILRFDTPHPDGVDGNQVLRTRFGFSTAPIVATRTTQVIQPVQVVIDTTTNGATNNEVQYVHQDVGQTENWTLEYDGQVTAALPVFASATDVQLALEALSNIGVGDVNVLFENLGTEVRYTVTFQGALAGTNVVQMYADVYGAEDGMTYVSTHQGGGPVNEVQTVELSPAAVGGNFTLTYSGQTTGNIAWNASAATVQSALEALSNIGVGDVAVTGSAGGIWTVTFQGALGGTNVSEMTGSPGTLIGAVNEKQEVRLFNAGGGTFTLTYDGQTTGNIAYNASAATVQTALEALSNIGSGDVTVTGSSGGPWTIEYTGANAGLDVPLITGDPSILTPATPSGTLRVRGLVAYADKDNYIAAEVYITDSGCDSLRLYRKSGGVETQLGNSQTIIGATLEGEYVLRVCWDPYAYGAYAYEGYGIVRASLTGGGLEFPYGNQAIAQASGAYVGIATAEGIPKFGELQYKYMKDDQGHQACPDCNTPSCSIGSDPFDNESRTICLWDAGTWDSGDGGQFLTTGYSRFRVHHPTNKASQSASAIIVPTDSLDVSLGINSYNATNGLFVAYTTTATTQTLELFRNTTSLGTKTVNVAPGTVPKTIYICYSEGMLSASVDGSEDLCLDTLTYEVSDGYWAALGGTGTWKGFTFSKTYDSESPKDVCPDCDPCGQPPVCTNCQDDTSPEFLKVRYPDGIHDSGVFTGQSALGGCCGVDDFVPSPPDTKGCHNVRGTFIVQNEGGGNPCEWSKTWDLPGFYCPVDSPAPPNAVGINGRSGAESCSYSIAVATDWKMIPPGDPAWNNPGGPAEGTYRLRGILYGYANADNTIWEHSFGPNKPDCRTWNELEVPLVYSPFVELVSPLVGCLVPDGPCFVTSL